MSRPKSREQAREAKRIEAFSGPEDDDTDSEGGELCECDLEPTEAELCSMRCACCGRGLLWSN